MATKAKMGLVDTTVGLNASKISKMDKALDSYITAVNKTIGVAASMVNIEKAIKGSSTEASVKQMNKDINNKLKSYVSGLQGYKAVLDELKSSYAKQDNSNTTFTKVSTKVTK